MPSFRLALAQLNVTVGDLQGNRRRIVQAFWRAKAWLADVVVVPELAVTGYPPEDLLLKPQFIEDNLTILRSLAGASRGLVAVVGFVDRDRHGALSNAAAVLADGQIARIYHKQCLPNYGVFDEKRYFTPGTDSGVVNVDGVRCGLTICEDLWEPEPCRRLTRARVQLVINLSASPYHAGKLQLREQLFRQRARANRVAIAYCNLVGGQDELVFDGGSLVLDARGHVIARGEQLKEDLVVVDIELAGGRAGRTRRARPALPHLPRALLSPVAEVYEALVLGLQDYVRKNGFSTVILGLSGGVDSALTACIAVDAVGPERVIALVMPSRYSSAETQADARALAHALGITAHELSIEPIFRATLETLGGVFAGRSADVTEQNLQARIRGMLTMALSNKFGWLVLTTGNKSELATGYCTLYGDMAGGFAVIKDVPKTLVYRLARHRNQRGRSPVIPESVLTRVPTAELAPNQTDQDTLPPYDVLDRILKAYVEEDRSVRDLLRTNRVAPEVAKQVTRMVDRSEYKRRQSPPGIKITPKAFGRDRRMPLTNRYQQG
jgi:NAD+ synthase (glutamine-hydrolysing)